MAFDEVLLERVSAPTLRLYRWLTPAVSFGYFIRHADVVALWPGRELVRRMTGGGMVDHRADLTYSLILPSAHPLAICPPRDSYRSIHAAIAAWMDGRGINTHLAPQPGANSVNVCFESPAEFDLVTEGRKIAGAAQRRTRSGLLHQGSILYVGVCEEDRNDLPSAFTPTWTEEPPEQGTLDAATELAARKYALRSWIERV